MYSYIQLDILHTNYTYINQLQPHEKSKGCLFRGGVSPHHLGFGRD